MKILLSILLTSGSLLMSMEIDFRNRDKDMGQLATIIKIGSLQDFKDHEDILRRCKHGDVIDLQCIAHCYHDALDKIALSENSCKLLLHMQTYIMHTFQQNHDVGQLKRLVTLCNNVALIKHAIDLSGNETTEGEYIALEKERLVYIDKALRQAENEWEVIEDGDYCNQSIYKVRRKEEQKQVIGKK